MVPRCWRDIQNTISKWAIQELSLHTQQTFPSKQFLNMSFTSPFGNLPFFTEVCRDFLIDRQPSSTRDPFMDIVRKCAAALTPSTSSVKSSDEHRPIKIKIRLWGTIYKTSSYGKRVRRSTRKQRKSEFDACFRPSWFPQ